MALTPQKGAKLAPFDWGGGGGGGAARIALRKAMMPCSKIFFVNISPKRSALQFQIQVSDSDSYSALNMKRVNCREQNVELLYLISRNKRNSSRTSIFRH
jgi:hypothetical protein